MKLGSIQIRKTHTICLENSKDGYFDFIVSKWSSPGLVLIELEECSKNGQEDTHIYVTAYEKAEEDAWELESNEWGCPLEYWSYSAEHFLKQLNKYFPPSRAYRYLDE